MVEPTVYLSIGSNIEPRMANLRQAVQRIKNHPAIYNVRVASLYETEPWGKLDPPNFYNSAIALQTSLSPLELLKVLQQIEREGHRVRHEHWGPRTIDLDIILWGTQQLQTPVLTIPHPQAANRRFVVLPIMELAKNDSKVKPIVQRWLTELTDKSWLKQDSWEAK